MHFEWVANSALDGNDWVKAWDADISLIQTIFFIQSSHFSDKQSAAF